MSNHWSMFEMSKRRRLVFFLHKRNDLTEFDEEKSLDRSKKKNKSQ